MIKHKTIEKWFSSDILVADGSEVLDIARNIFDNFDFSKYEKYNYQTTYFNQDDFPDVDGLEKFRDILELAASSLAEQQGVDLEKYRVVITSIWINRMISGGHHSKHAHPASTYSGTFYVNCPNDSSKIRFYNPIENLWAMSMPPISNKSPSSSMTVEYQPEPGLILIWNSWLLHEVLPYTGTSHRDTISFNFNCVDTKTNRLV